MTVDKRANYYTSEPAISSAAITAGLKKLTEECQRVGAKRAWLVLNTKQNISGIVGSAIGQQGAGNLHKGVPFQLAQDCSVTLYTERTLPHRGDDTPVLACHPTEKLLTRLDGLLNVPALIVLPWKMGEIHSWVQTHGPTDLLGKSQPTVVSVANPVVERALESLWSAINASTGISHPLDKHKAIHTFKILQKGGEAYTPAEVRSWLVRKGMDPRHAGEVADIAAAPDKHRSTRGSAPAWREDILTLWRQEAKQPQEGGSTGEAQATLTQPLPETSEL